MGIAAGLNKRFSYDEPGSHDMHLFDCVSEMR